MRTNIVIDEALHTLVRLRRQETFASYVANYAGRVTSRPRAQVVFWPINRLGTRQMM